MAPSPYARLAVLGLMGLANYVAFTFVALLGPFFPSFARETYQASSVATGMVFALYPAAQIAVCPLASVLCRRFGRVPVCYAGLSLLSASTLLFAFGASMTQFMVARVLQGSAGALVNVSAIAVVMEFSNNLARDMGLQEVITGVGYMSGPPLGGLLYTYLGIRPMFLLLSLTPVAMMVLLSASLRWLGVSWSRDESSSSGPSAASLLRDRTVVLVALSLVADAAAIGFMDPVLARHLFLVLGLDVKTAGFFFAISPLVYCLSALAVGSVVDRIGNKPTIAAGLLIVSASYVLMGPVPLLDYVLPSSPPGPPLTIMWGLMAACQLGVGLGSALICVPAVPLMLHAVERSSPGVDLKDPVAAVYIWAWGLGDFVGPLLGGFLEDVLPKTPEVVCVGYNRGDEGCLTAFRWAAALYGGGVLLLWVLLAALVPSDAAETATEKERTADVEGALMKPPQQHLQQRQHDGDDERQRLMSIKPFPGPGTPMVMEAAAINGMHYQSIGPPPPRMKESF